MVLALVLKMVIQTLRPLVTALDYLLAQLVIPNRIDDDNGITLRFVKAETI